MISKLLFLLRKRFVHRDLKTNIHGLRYTSTYSVSGSFFHLGFLDEKTWRMVWVMGRRLNFNRRSDLLKDWEYTIGKEKISLGDLKYYLNSFKTIDQVISENNETKSRINDEIKRFREREISYRNTINDLTS